MRWPYILSLVALLGAGLLLFFNILCGATNHAPLNKWYWLEADTSSIPGANSMTRWTNYDSCGVSNGKNTDCSSRHAAYPMSPVSNFGTTRGVPSGLSSKRGVTYYLSKVGWAFLLIGLLFTLLALIPVLVSFCIPALTVLNVVTSTATNAALLFTTLSACLITAAYVKARNAFKNDGKHTSLGKTMLAFIWTSVFLLFLSSLFSGVGCLANLLGNRKKKRYSEGYDSSSHETYGNDYTHEKDANTKRGGFFSRMKKKKKNEDIEDVGYAAGLGASGATSDYTATRGGTGTGTGTGQTRGVGTGAGVGAAAVGTAAAAGVMGSKKDEDVVPASRDPNTGETIKDVGYGAGVGASGATSNAKDTSGTGETLDDVGYAAGLGASGATSNVKSPKGAGYSSTRDPNTGETLEDVAYAAGLGASGATSSVKASKGTGNSSTRDPNTGEKLDDVAYAAGLGASGATSNAKVSKPKTSGTAGYDSTKGPKTGETLDDVAYAAGLGASGATSNYTQKTTTGTSGHGAGRGQGSTDYATGTGYGNDGSQAKSKSNKDEVAYAAGLGASGATSGYTQKADGGYGTAGQDRHVPSSKPYDTDAAVGAQEKTTSSSGQSKGLLASAAAALGIGGGAAAATSAPSKPDHSGTYIEGEADTGVGATKSGLNASNEPHRSTYENKSTVLPVGHDSGHISSDPNGNRGGGYNTDEHTAAAAAAAATAGVTAGGATDVSGSHHKGTYVPVKDGAATRAEDTYNNTQSNLGKTNKDLTTTGGYEPTTYYTRNAHDAGLDHHGTSHDAYGATSGQGQEDSEYTGKVNKYGNTGYGNTAAGHKASGYDNTTSTAPQTSTQGDTTTSTGKGPSTGSKMGAAAAAGAAGASAAGYGAGKSQTSKPGYDNTTYGTGKSSSTGYDTGKSSGYGSKSTSKTYGSGYDDTTKSTTSKSGQGTTGAAIAGTAAAAGLAGSSSKKTQDTSATKDPKTGETLDDVARAAGYGASGATSDLTKKRSDSSAGGEKRKSSLGNFFGLGGKSKRDSTTSSFYDDDLTGQTGRQTSYDQYDSKQAGDADVDDYTKTSGTSKGTTTAAGVGATGAAAYASANHSQNKNGSQTKETRGSDYSSSSRGTDYQTHSALDPKRNRNPIAEGIASGDVSKPANADTSKFESNTGDKLEGKAGDTSRLGRDTAAGATTAGVGASLGTTSTGTSSSKTGTRGTTGSSGVTGASSSRTTGATGATGATSSKGLSGSGEEGLPGSFPGGTSPTQAAYGSSVTDSNYTTGRGGTSSQTTEPRSFARRTGGTNTSGTATELEDGVEKPSLVQQIVDTAKNVI